MILSRGDSAGGNITKNQEHVVDKYLRKTTKICGNSFHCLEFGHLFRFDLSLISSHLLTSISSLSSCQLVSIGHGQQDIYNI